MIFSGIVILAYNIAVSIKNGVPAGDNPWGARTLEWMTSSPPPEHNFEGVPVVMDRPHTFGIEGAVHARIIPQEEFSKDSPEGLKE